MHNEESNATMEVGVTKLFLSTGQVRVKNTKHATCVRVRKGKQWLQVAWDANSQTFHVSASARVGVTLATPASFNVIVDNPQ